MVWTNFCNTNVQIVFLKSRLFHIPIIVQLGVIIFRFFGFPVHFFWTLSRVQKYSVWLTFTFTNKKCYEPLGASFWQNTPNKMQLLHCFATFKTTNPAVWTGPQAWFITPFPVVLLFSLWIGNMWQWSKEQFVGCVLSASRYAVRHPQGFCQPWYCSTRYVPDLYFFCKSNAACPAWLALKMGSPWARGRTSP